MEHEADRKAAIWILRDFWGNVSLRERTEEPYAHLLNCEDITVGPWSSDTSIACASGCDHIELIAEILCPHGSSVKWTYGTWGDLADILYYMEAADFVKCPMCAHNGRNHTAEGCPVCSCPMTG